MSNRKKILLVGDQPGWAFHNIMNFIRKNLSSNFDLYFDFVVYHPAFEDPNKEISSKANQNFIFKKNLIFNKIPIFRGLEYKLIKKLNKLNLLGFNEHGKFQRVTEDNHYDLVVYLDHYFPFDGDFSHIHSNKIVQGTFSDVFPPRKLFRIPATGEIKPIQDGHEFCQVFLKSADALLIGAPAIRVKYEKFYDKAILFANMAYDEKIFSPKHSKENNKFVLGWTGNPGPSMFMEASLCGVPSVSTRIGMPAYVIVDHENGLFCDRNVADFVEKIALVIQYPELLEKMRVRIRKDYIEKLGVDVQIRNWENLFNQLIYA